jgi:UDP-N-acetylglucosamine--N-acetylmuramyl-(pentapeptide) pyrophosphoryl-undecaprenol N-acetylglucosamine transferase
MSTKKNKRIIISGGGTGGHIFPAIAIGKALQQLDKEIELLYVGAVGKMEMEKVPQAGFNIVGLNIAGFQRKLTLQNLSFPFKLIGSLWKAYRLVKKFNPAVAIGVGGYASGPTLKVASWQGIKTVLQEQNSLPGVTNQLLGKKASIICVAFEGMNKYFDADKLIITGNPIRESIVENKITKKEGAEIFGFDGTKKIVFVTGGSLGAGAINKGIASHVEALIAQDIQVIWQTGKFYVEAYKKYEADYPTHLRVLDFLPNIDAAYAAADVVVSRAGGTISELAILGKPSILLPSPNVAEDHQTHNVMSLVNHRAAILVKDKEANDTLVNTIVALVNNEEQQKELRKNISAMAKPNAAIDIAKAVLKLIQEEK